MGLLGSITSPYGAFESWAYDRFAAPAALDLVKRTGAAPWLKASRGAALLDVGCGGGHLLAEIARSRPDLELTGVDLSEAQLAHARRRVPRAKLLCGSALALPVPDESMDVVVSIGSVKHWTDRAAGLDQCVRALLVGGALLLVEFDRRASAEDIAEFVSRWRPPSFVLGRIVERMRKNIFEKSVDTAELEALARRLPLDELDVSHVTGTPVLRLVGRRSALGAATAAGSD